MDEQLSTWFSLLLAAGKWYLETTEVTSPRMRGYSWYRWLIRSWG